MSVAAKDVHMKLVEEEEACVETVQAVLRNVFRKLSTSRVLIGTTTNSPSDEQQIIACSVQAVTSRLLCVADVTAHVKLLSDADIQIADTTESLTTTPSSRTSSRTSSIDDIIEDPRCTDLAHFRAISTDFEAMPDGAFTMVRRLAKGINGDIFSYIWHHDGDVAEPVAVKRLRNDRLQRIRGTETDERLAHQKAGINGSNPEDPLKEIGLLSYLAQQADLPLYILHLRAVFAAAASCTWLVTELAEGGELFNVVQNNGAVAEPQACRYMWQILQALKYLHEHQVGHRDMSLENILLKDGNVRVMDFGMAVRSHSASGTPHRYYRAVGKGFYRAPECYVPTATEVRVVAPADSTPGEIAMVNVVGLQYLCEVRLPLDAVPGYACKAEPWGYEPLPADVHACGVIICMMSYGVPVWHQATLRDNTFKFVQAQGLKKLFNVWKKPLLADDTMDLMTKMLTANPADRPTAAECLASNWFSEFRDTPVPLHEKRGGSPSCLDGKAAAMASMGGA
jgi:serine/threonine protein kinase